MSNDIQEQDTIFRNIGLITTRWNIFVFLIHPFISWAWLTYTVTQLSKGGILASHRHFIFALIIWPCCAALLALVTGEKIKARLEQEGYVQRRTRAREIDLALNFAVIGAFYYWADNYEGDGKEGAFATVALAVFGGVMMWWIIVMISLGSVLWFTVKVR